MVTERFCILRLWTKLLERIYFIGQQKEKSLIAFLYLIKTGPGQNCTKTKMHEGSKLHEGTKMHGSKIARVHKIARR